MGIPGWTGGTGWISGGTTDNAPPIVADGYTDTGVSGARRRRHSENVATCCH